MRMHLELDTSSATDLAQMATLATAFSGGKTPQAAAAATKQEKKEQPVKQAEQPETNTDSDSDALAEMPAPTKAERVTIEMVRAVAATKDGKACKAAMKELGVNMLSDAPTDKLPALLERFKELPNK